MLSTKELVSMARMNKNTIYSIFNSVSCDSIRADAFLNGYEDFIESIENGTLGRDSLDEYSEISKEGFRQGANNIYGIIRWERDREISAVESKYSGLIDSLGKAMEGLK